MVTPTHAEDPLHNIRAALARDREDEALAIAVPLVISTWVGLVSAALTMAWLMKRTASDPTDRP